jgi:hypothetical protein
LPPPATPVPSSLSYSALGLYARCPYRFRLERIGGLPAAPPGGAAAVGRAVHRAIELGAGADAATLLREADPTADPADVPTVRDAIDRYTRSPLAARLAGFAEVRHEQPFAFLIGDVVIAGRYDLTAEEDGRFVIGDIKVGPLDGRRAEECRDADYAVQEAVYALAALEAGHEHVTVVYQWVGDDEAATHSAERTFGSADRDPLRARLATLVDGAVHGPWEARPSTRVCRDCPALGVVCAGTEGGGGDAEGHPYQSS